MMPRRPGQLRLQDKAPSRVAAVTTDWSELPAFCLDGLPLLILACQLPYSWYPHSIAYWRLLRPLSPFTSASP
jgi:hypothetical protein